MTKFLSDYLIERIKTCHELTEISSKSSAAKLKARAHELSELLGKIRKGELIVSTD